MGITVFAPALMPRNEQQRSAAAMSARLTMGRHIQQLSNTALKTKTELCVTWCGVMLIIDEHQHVLASSGGMTGTYRRATALSSYVVSDPSSPFIVLNPAEDERFSGNPFVLEGLIGFYAGVAIFDPQGLAVGAICVTSRTARRTFSPANTQKLVDAASRISSLIW